MQELGRPAPPSRDKALGSLSDVHLEWIAACPLAFLATSNAAGQCDVSPKGDPPGFIQVLDKHTVALPERVGNLRMDGYLNVLSNGHAGLILLIPGRPDTMRLNGKARLVTDGPFFDKMIVRNHRPKVALLLQVEEVYFHCPKAFARGRVWEPRAWQPDAARSYVAIANALWRSGETLQEIAAHYRTNDPASGLYPPNCDRDLPSVQGTHSWA